MTQIHSCRSSPTFLFLRKLHFHLSQINRLESLRILESGSQYTLIRHHLARWTSLFLRHFYHECCQHHNLFDCPPVSESSQFNVETIQFFEKLLSFNVPLSTRPTLVLEIVLSCRLVLNLRSAASEVSESASIKAMPGFLPWSNGSKTRIYANPSCSFIAGDQSPTTDFRGSTSTLGRVTNLEPNRALPEYTWNAMTLYTNKNETLWYSK